MRPWPLILILVLVACGGSREAVVSEPQPKPFTRRVADTVVDTGKGMFEAAQSPLEDVGIKRDKIPEKLQQIVGNPYVIVPPIDCEVLKKEIAELDALLERDVDAASTTDASGRAKYVEEGTDIMQDQATGFVGSKVGIIPLRGVVRRVSGAEKHARAVAKAYQAGRLRRAYLKGVMRASDCPSG